MINDVTFYYAKFPASVRGTTTINDDGTYTVYINKNMSIENQRKTVAHELQHIKRNDCYRYDEKAIDLENKIV